MRTDGFWRGVLRGTLKNVVTAICANQLDPIPAAAANALVEVIFERLARAAPRNPSGSTAGVPTRRAGPGSGCAS